MRVWPERTSLIYVSNWIESFEWNNLPSECIVNPIVFLSFPIRANHRRNEDTCECWLLPFTHAQTHLACNPNFIYLDWENNTDHKTKTIVHCAPAKSFYRNINPISNLVSFDVQIKMRTVDICTNSFCRPPKALAYNLTSFYLRCGANTKIGTTETPIWRQISDMLMCVAVDTDGRLRHTIPNVRPSYLPNMENIACEHRISDDCTTYVEHRKSN